MSPGRPILFLLLIVFAFAFWGGRSLRDSSEARYGESAREMLSGNDWTVPHLDGKIHLTKPPITYWLIAGGLVTLGNNAWGARLPLVFAFIVTVLCLWLIARRMGYTEAEALAACLIFATSGFSFVGSFVLTTDPFLTAFIAGAIACYWWHLETRNPVARIAFWVVFGLAFLTKGPPAWLHLLPVLVLQLRWTSLPRVRFLPGATLMVIVGFSWYLWMIAKDRGLIGYFLGDEVVNRILTTEHGRENSPLEYPLILVAGIFPYVFLWPGVAKRVWRFLTSKPLAGLRTLSPATLFLLSWLLLPLPFFLFAKSRMPLYMLPLFLPLSLLLGKPLAVWFERLENWSGQKRRAVFVGAGIWIVVLLFARATPDFVDSGRVYRDDARVFAPIVDKLPQETRIVWLLTRPRYGVGFYLNRTIYDLDLGHTEDLHGLTPFLRDNCLFVMETEEYDHLKDYRVEPLADSGKLSLVRLHSVE